MRRHDPLDRAADGVARDFLGTVYRNVREFEVTLLRNAILDCLFVSTEPDFIAKVDRNRLFQSDFRRIMAKAKPHLLDLIGRTLADARGFDDVPALRETA